jgi:dTMP kinase
MKKNNFVGKFIVFEGLDGSGQSTQVNLLKKLLEEKSKKVIATKEPTLDSQSGKKIREALDEKIKFEPMSLQELYTQDRKEHLENKVIPALKEGKVVISDRYFFSTFAYGSSEGLDMEKLIEMNSDFLMPDIVFFLKVRPEVCVERIEKRGEGVKLFEKKEKLEKVEEKYMALVKRFDNIYLLDGEESIKEVFKQVKNKLNQKKLWGEFSL